MYYMNGSRSICKDTIAASVGDADTHNTKAVQKGQLWCPLYRGSTVYRTASWVPMVSSIERFHCIQDSQLGCNGLSIERFHCMQDSQLGPNGVLYREVPLYTGQPAGSYGVLYREVPLYTGQPAGSQWYPL